LQLEPEQPQPTEQQEERIQKIIQIIMELTAVSKFCEHLDTVIFKSIIVVTLFYSISRFRPCFAGASALLLLWKDFFTYTKTWKELEAMNVVLGY